MFLKGSLEQGNSTFASYATFQQYPVKCTAEMKTLKFRDVFNRGTALQRSGAKVCSGLGVGEKNNNNSCSHVLYKYAFAHVMRLKMKARGKSCRTETCEQGTTRTRSHRGFDGVSW